MTILCGDATELLPPDGTVFYLFNPFDESVMRRFAEAMLDRRAPGDDRLLNAKLHGPFAGDPRFTVRAPNDPARAQLPLGAGNGALSPIRRSRSRITPQASANATEESEHGHAGSGHPPLVAEDDDQRQHHRRLDAVGDEPKAGPADRDRERLRPAQHELDRRGDEDEPRRRDCRAGTRRRARAG